jgi:phage baseplate assembly protein W
MNVAFPYCFDGRGRTAGASHERHVRDMIEQVLFTTPGERVNRPDFGSGLLQLTFAPNSDELAGATQFMVQSALQQWLGELIAIEGVEVTAEEAALRVTVRYTINQTGAGRVDEFSRGGAPA